MRSRALFFLLLPLVVACGGDDPVEPGNQPPHIRGIAAVPNVVSRGGTSRLTALASDPDNDSLSYHWSAAAGTFSGAFGETIFWRAPDATGIFAIRLIVSDGVLADTLTANLTVGSGTVYITSQPAGYPILLDGIDTGKVTPDSLRQVAIGDYSVGIGGNLFRFTPSETTFTLSDQEIVIAQFRLPRATIELVDTGPQPMDEIGGFTYFPGGIGVLYAARVASDTSLRSASLVPTHTGQNGRVLHRPIMLLESIAARPPSSRPAQIAFVSADQILIGDLKDLGNDGLVDQIDSLAAVGGVFVDKTYGPAFSLDGTYLGYAFSPSTPPNSDDFLLAGLFDGRNLVTRTSVASDRLGNSLYFGPEPLAVFESGGEVYEAEIDPLFPQPAELLSDAGGDALAPAMSPNGRFVVYVDTGEGALKLMARPDKTTVTLLSPVSTSRVAWSPNGRELLIADNSIPGNARLKLVYNLPIR